MSRYKIICFQFRSILAFQILFLLDSSFAFNFPHLPDIASKIGNLLSNKFPPLHNDLNNFVEVELRGSIGSDGSMLEPPSGGVGDSFIIDDGFLNERKTSFLRLLAGNNSSDSNQIAYNKFVDHSNFIFDVDDGFFFSTYPKQEDPLHRFQKERDQVMMMIGYYFVTYCCCYDNPILMRFESNPMLNFFFKLLVDFIFIITAPLFVVR